MPQFVSARRTTVPRRAVLAGALAAAGAARAQPAAPPWRPDRPILLITGFAPGGATDVAARILQDKLAAALGGGAPIVVEGRPGASGVVATNWLKGRPADGYTIMLQETGGGVVAPIATVGGTGYDPIADFTHLGIISTPPSVLIVNNGFAPAGADARQILAKLRDAPAGSLNYASSGFGGALHFRAEVLARALGTSFVHVPYRSGGQMVTAVLTGEAPFGFASMAGATPFIQDGRVRAVALSGARRFPLFPDLPLLSELGVPGLENSGYYALVGPPGLPAPVAAAFNRALVATLQDAGVRERLVLAGHDPVTGPNTSEHAIAFMERQVRDTQRMVADTGIRLQR